MRAVVKLTIPMKDVCSLLAFVAPYRRFILLDIERIIMRRGPVRNCLVSVTLLCVAIYSCPPPCSTARPRRLVPSACCSLARAARANDVSPWHRSAVRCFGIALFQPAGLGAAALSHGLLAHAAARAAHPDCPYSLLLTAVMVCAWYGMLRSGPMATVTASLVTPPVVCVDGMLPLRPFVGAALVSIPSAPRTRTGTVATARSH